MEHAAILDVTLIEPRFKHPKIFEQFDALIPGEAFIIHNDHDPKPLYYQLLGERGNVFTWDYLEEGPEFWKVRIAKRGTEDRETIGEMVAADYRKAQVFKKLGIDFCCGGKKTLEEACAKNGLDVGQVKEELSSVSQQGDSASLSYDKWELDFLIDYIINTHHAYVKEAIPFISGLANKVARVHGDHHPELIDLALIFDKVAKDFGLHLMKEENAVFPYIKELLHEKKSGIKPSDPDLENVSVPVQLLEVEHELAGDDLLAIRRLTNQYLLPEDACTSYTILFKKLAEFENNLFDHVHLENNILFPKAVQLEKDLAS
jgi:regulator of cell morphogenesis and NO signaling